MVSRSRSTATTIVAREFVFSRLPLPGWHELLAAAFAERVGPNGTLRTLTSTRNCWEASGRLMRASTNNNHLRPPPGTDAHRHQVVLLAPRGKEPLAHSDLRYARSVLLTGRLGTLLPPQVVDFLQQRLPGRNHLGGEPGYSDGELTRLVSAARRRRRVPGPRSRPDLVAR